MNFDVNETRTPHIVLVDPDVEVGSVLIAWPSPTDPGCYVYHNELPGPRCLWWDDLIPLLQRSVVRGRWN